MLRESLKVTQLGNGRTGTPRMSGSQNYILEPHYLCKSLTLYRALNIQGSLVKIINSDVQNLLICP